MNRLENIVGMVERLAAKIDAVACEREGMSAEISGLRESVVNLDKEAVKAAHDFRAELEAAKLDALRSAQDRASLESKLQGMNDRLVSLALESKNHGGRSLG